MAQLLFPNWEGILDGAVAGKVASNAASMALARTRIGSDRTRWTSDRERGNEIVDPLDSILVCAETFSIRVGKFVRSRSLPRSTTDS